MLKFPYFAVYTFVHLVVCARRPYVPLLLSNRPLAQVSRLFGSDNHLLCCSRYWCPHHLLHWLTSPSLSLHTEIVYKYINVYLWLGSSDALMQIRSMEIISHHCSPIDRLGYMGVYLDTQLLLYCTSFASPFLFQASKEKQEIHVMCAKSPLYPLE